MMIIFLLLYDALLVFAIILYIPVYILKRKFSVSAFFQKLSFFPTDTSGYKGSIWIQVVSVGEAFAARKLIDKLSQAADHRIIISTTTITGNRVAQKLYSSLGKVIFFPFDHTIILRRAIEKIKPIVFVAVETEIWPNLFYQLNKNNIPIVIINGRISDRAYAKYMKIKFFIKRVLNLCSYIGTQNNLYERRFLSLGAPKEKVVISGNMKFDALDVSDEEIDNFKKEYGPLLKKDKKPLLVVASTHYPEEKIILNIYRDLLKISDLNLLIAPRHPERAKEIERLILSFGFNPVMVSKIKNNDSSLKNIFVLDTIGDLFHFYSLADLCFVGGSLINCGGHNILEPMYFLKPTIFGPFMNNFREIEKTVLEYKAAIKVEDAKELKDKLSVLLRDANLGEELSNNCFRIFSEEKKYLKNNLEIILKCLR